MSSGPGALAGVRVVDFTSFLPGPYATMILGDNGADVIKIERPGVGDPGRHSAPTVDGVATRHRIVNRNKRSVELDLRDPEGLAAARALIDRADVLVEGFRAGSMARLGLDYATVSSTNPGLVYCSIGGYPAGSADADEPAHDINFMGLAGLLAPDPSTGEMAMPLTQYADIAGGSFRAVMGVLMALLDRARTGLGQHVEASLMEGAVALQMEAFAHLVAGQEFRPGDTRLTGRFPCYRVYQTSDGRFMAVGATEPVYWTNLCRLLGRPDLVSEQYASGPAAVRAIAELGAVFESRTQAEWVAALERRQTCCTPVRSFAEAFGSPDAIRPPMRLGDADTGPSRPAPGLGQHTLEVLGDLLGQEPQGGGQSR